MIHIEQCVFNLYSSHPQQATALPFPRWELNKLHKNGDYIAVSGGPGVHHKKCRTLGVHWLKKVEKCWHTPSWTVWGNLRFEKESYSNVLVFYGYFYKRNRKHFPPVFPIRYRNTRGSLGELELRIVQFLVLPNFHSCFYNCMETWKMFSIS